MPKCLVRFSLCEPVADGSCAVKTLSVPVLAAALPIHRKTSSNGPAEGEERQRE
jgi:hypothetical protein